MPGRGKFSNEMMHVIASSLRELHKKDLLMFANGQQLIDVEFKNGKLVIHLADPEEPSDNVVSAPQRVSHLLRPTQNGPQSTLKPAR